MKIGNITLSDRAAVLAPMTKITDLPFRLLCRKLGAELAFTEMVNCNAVSRGNKAARKIYFTIDEDRPLGVQLFGSHPGKIVLAAKEVIKSYQDVFIDVNFSCPDQRVIGQGAGAALLKRPKRMGEIIRGLVNEVDQPVTAKIRLRSLDTTKNVKTALMLEKAGVSALTVHARTIEQKNAGATYWKAVKEIKQAVSVPVIGNGGVQNLAGFRGILLETSCDAVMVGKAAIYKPGLFENLGKNNDREEFSFEKRLSWLKTYAELAEASSMMNTDRLLQRARDFLRPYIPLKRIERMFYQAGNVDSFLSLLGNEQVSD